MGVWAASRVVVVAARVEAGCLCVSEAGMGMVVSCIDGNSKNVEFFLR